MKNNAEINDVTAKCQQSGTEIISTQENRDAQPRQSMQFHIFRNAAPIYAHRAHEVGSLVPRSRHERTVLSCTDVGAADTHDRWGLSACESGAHTVRSCGAGEAARQGRPGVLFSLLLLILMLLPGMARSASADDWTDPNNLPNTSGIYKLQVDVTADYWFRQRGTTLLDLNGHILTITDDPGIVVQQKATLNITDSKGGGSIIFNKGSLKVTLGELALSYCTIQGDVILEPTELSSADVSCIMNRSTIEGSIYMNEGSFVSSYPQYTNTMEIQNGSTIRCSADACVKLNDEKAVFELRGGSIRANGV